jgi:hypothetical protein
MLPACLAALLAGGAPQGFGPPRCGRCKGYLNLFVGWEAGGDQWRCNMCAMLNPTPAAYRCPLDGRGQRLDAAARPELSKGSVDFLTTPECVSLLLLFILHKNMKIKICFHCSAHWTQIAVGLCRSREASL